MENKEHREIINILRGASKSAKSVFAATGKKGAACKVQAEHKLLTELLKGPDMSETEFTSEIVRILDIESVNICNQGEG